ncbi:MAG TPA: FlgD immunoglobulin-like domain containing protein [Candidatus Cloacimonadota bacterium]|nr:FlgD immunoglobulin-like domain containing protein [Candidatus Neomarinimicrobiota bacterium]HPM02526.1 FlgD immunoglobulin-like domain containing protein [Candidatus Cloacimonadota bacterium]
MKRNKLLMVVIIICICFTLLSAQTEQDTLYYYNPDQIINEIFPIVATVETLAVYFKPDSLIPKYKLKELHFLILSDIEWYWGALPHSRDIHVHTAPNDSAPGPIIAEIPITINDATEIFPHWKIVSLSNYSELNNLNGNFWVSGWLIWGTVHDSFPPYSVNTYEYSDCRWTNLYTPGFFVKAIIEYSCVSIHDQDKNAPCSINLLNNYPNPFNSETTIRYSLSENCDISLKIYNLVGRLITNINMTNQVAGYHQIVWKGKDLSGNDVPSGIYFYNLSVYNDNNYQTQCKKMILIK